MAAEILRKKIKKSAGEKNKIRKSFRKNFGGPKKNRGAGEKFRGRKKFRAGEKNKISKKFLKKISKKVFEKKIFFGAGQKF